MGNTLYDSSFVIITELGVYTHGKERLISLLASYLVRVLLDILLCILDVTMRWIM